VFKENTQSDETDDETLIDIQGIKDSVLDTPRSEVESAGPEVQFSFGVRHGEGGKLDFAVAKDSFEREFIVQALKLNKGKINQTALNANIPKKTLLRKIEKYVINPKDYY
jgi:two-component system response regulator HydG